MDGRVKTLKKEAADAELRISATSGVLLGMTWRGRELLRAASALFSLGMLAEDGVMTVLDSRRFEDWRVQTRPSGVRIEAGGCADYPSLRVRVDVRGAAGGVFRFRPRVTGVPTTARLCWLAAPIVELPGDGELFWPRTSGTLVRGAALQKPMRTYGWPNNQGGGQYPGLAPMQFMAYMRDGLGLYVAAEDRQHGPKQLEYGCGVDSTALQLQVQAFTGCAAGENCAPNWDVVLRPFGGDWMDAAALYRSWLKRDLTLPALPRNYPSWLATSPIVMCTMVRGDHRITEEPNEFFPLARILPPLRRLRGLLDSRMMVLLMRWEGTSPWAPPYIWPPLGGTEAFAEFSQTVHDEGDLMGVYASGVAWTQYSKIGRYDRQQDCDEALLSHMVRGPKGELEAACCSSIRFGYDLCVAENWPRQVVKDEIRKVAAAGVDFCQFFDQNQGGDARYCFAAHHRHPPTPGAWSTQAMQSLQAECCDTLRGMSSPMLLGTEAEAAEPYLAGLALNDSRFTYGYNVGMPVPAYSFVFHEYVATFMGNQCGVDRQFDFQRCPDNLLYRMAWGFAAGYLLSMNLGPSGQLHWGAASPWDKPLPEQEPAVTLLKNINQVRRQYPDFLLHGRMEKPCLHCECGEFSVYFSGGRGEPVPVVMQSAWRNRAGSRLELLVNYTRQAQRVAMHCQQGWRLHASAPAALRENGAFELPALTALALKVVRTKTTQ